MKYTVTDGYSKRANPSRGYHDYECKIEFERYADGWTTTEEGQRRIVNAILELYKNDMWKHVIKVDGYTWIISHGYDSGD